MSETVELFRSKNQGISFHPSLTPFEILTCINKLKTFQNILRKMCERKSDGVVTNYTNRCSLRLAHILSNIDYSKNSISDGGFVFFDEIKSGFTPSKLDLEDLAYIIDNLFISFGFVDELHEFLDNRANKEPEWKPFKLFLKKERADMNSIKSKISFGN